MLFFFQLPERVRGPSHGVHRGDGPASGVQPRARLHHGRGPLLPAPQRIPRESPPHWTHRASTYSRRSLCDNPVTHRVNVWL